MFVKGKTIIELRHYSLPVNFPVLLLTGERWRISDIKSDRLHFHGCLEIGICHSDSGTLQIQDQTLPFHAEDITCIPRHLPHTTYSDPDTQSLWSYIFFDPDALFKNLFRSSSNNFERPTANIKVSHYIFSKDKYPKIHQLATTVLKELIEKSPYYQDSVRGLLFALYIELIRINSRERSNEEDAGHENMLVIQPALNFIYKNYMQAISIDALAEMCYLSPTHFRRIFHEIVGTSPSAFIKSTRIDEACKLLQATDDSVISISEQVGFHSISSFNRCFSKLLDVSPREWRKRAFKNEALKAKASILEFEGWL